MRTRFKQMAALAFSLWMLLSPLWAGAAYRPIIDAGHGGEDGGAVYGKVVEKQVNLEVALRLRALFHLYGVRPVMLRETDVSLHEPEATTLRQKKVSDLKNRVKATNAVEDGFLISIHQNMFTVSRYRGSHVFFNAQEESRQFAGALQNAIREHIDPENRREEAPVANSLYLMQRATCPAVLVECGFLSNAAERALLQTPAYQKKLSLVLAASFLRFEPQEPGRAPDATPSLE